MTERALLVAVKDAGCAPRAARAPLTESAAGNTTSGQTSG
jgi:hypothetical protein